VIIHKGNINIGSIYGGQMNPNFGQKFQQQMMAQQQKQMADAQRRNMQIAWELQQRKDREGRDRERKDQVKSSTGSKPQPAWQPSSALDERFTKIEAEVAQLNQELTAGQLSEDAYKQKMQELMIEDDQGNWWLVGASSGAWYRFSGQDWIQATPPGRNAQVYTPPSTTPLGAISAPKSHGHPFRAILLFLFLLAVVAGAGYAMGWALDYLLHFGDIAQLLGACIVWVLGLIWSFSRARRLWRGD
jgi:hypothetical protein